MTPADRLLADFLGEMEFAEASLLAWGLVDAFTAEQEMLDRADDFLARRSGWAHFADGQALLDAAWERRLVFQWHEGGNRYRSRFAETLRLLARLRQLFPKHLQHPGAWLLAPTLVADFRLILRPRSYPRRDIRARDALEGWSETDADGRKLTAMQRQVLGAMIGLNGSGDGFSLAGFQARATRRILGTAGNGAAVGTVVCAGTGSGKTLAFYLPALAHLAGSIEQDSDFWTRALALYPRKELLKDQLTECSRLARVVNTVLRQRHRRPLRIGALYGDVPNNAEKVMEKEAWRATAGGYVCPFLNCPEVDCGGDMVWSDADRAAELEQLRCGRCGALLRTDEVVLTRQRMRREPPDILFTTTEMMNRRLSDSRQWHLFGVGVPPAKRPALVLLDEAHTYAGLHGAQVAYLLRRWRHRSGSTPHIVGLSATLMEASAFFSQLTGLPDHLVEEVSAEPAELMHEGIEYLVAVRGDPVSGASLLSTTIQTAMLLRRALDTGGGNVSHGFFGSKLFVFTDNLDVTNRLYFNLLDAEGLDSRGAPDRRRHPGGSLAALRHPQLSEATQRRRHGQSWDVCEEIGHRLRDDTLRIGRVSSQDAGVDATAEMIVATAALEVGFNDPAVGAVLQHKAPHDDATFLQRKGRAGRRREMRPWLVVVLSDYGRDRLAYSGYDLLFDPELRPRDLPLRNRHVLKMQAVYAVLDWLGTQIPGNLHGQMWSDASGPWRENEPAWQQLSQERQAAAAHVLEDVLAGGDSFVRLQQYLAAALRLRDEAEVAQLLWEPPRALLTAALPTLLRRLQLGWLAGDEPGAEYHVSNHPLPEFVPASLFTDLNLPEIVVWAVVSRSGGPEPSPLPATQALREFAPGRISRRFGIWHRSTRHWIPVDPAQPSPQLLELEGFCPANDREALGDFEYRTEDGLTTALPVFRPYALWVRHDAPANIADSANASLDWRSQIRPPRGANPGLAADLPTRSRWERIIPEMRFFTHQQNQPARLRRFALGSRAEVRFTDGNTMEITTRFAVDGAAAALGFAFETDAMRVRVRFPDQWQLREETWRALRPAHFRARLAADPRLDGSANRFDREWLAEVALSALTANAISLDVSLPEAWEAIRNGSASVSLDAVLEVIFQSVPLDAEAEADAAARLEQKRHKELSQLLVSETVAQTLDSLMPLLWEDFDAAQLNEWLEQRFLSTLGAALLMAIQQVCPDADTDDLVVDLDGGVGEVEVAVLPPGTADIWITESSPGGGGVIERFLPRLAEEPRRFLDLLVSTLGESDFEAADSELTLLLEWLVAQNDAELTAAVDAVRGVTAQHELIAAFANLRGLLRLRGLHTTHAVMTAIAARLLRPGSTVGTDHLLRETITRWRGEEARLGVEIEARALAYALSTFDALDDALGGAPQLGAGQDVRQWRFSTLYGLLWPRGAQARNHGLNLRNPYSALPPAERLLVLDALAPAEPEIVFGSEGWARRVEIALVENARTVISAEPSQTGPFRHALLRQLVTPVDSGTLLLYPRLRALHRRRNTLAVTLDLTAPGQIAPGEMDESDADSTSRLIIRTMRGGRDEVRDLIESLIVTELLSPGAEIWLVSPWITDLALLDNRSGAYTGLEPAWPKRYLSLAELLAFALRTSPQTRVRVVTRPDAHNRRFCERLRALADLDLTSSRLQIESNRETLHVKGFAGSTFALKGSMNFTYNGIEVLEEAVELETEPRRVAQWLLNFGMHYPMPA